MAASVCSGIWVGRTIACMYGSPVKKLAPSGTDGHLRLSKHLDQTTTIQIVKQHYSLMRLRFALFSGREFDTTNRIRKYNADHNIETSIRFR